MCDNTIKNIKNTSSYVSASEIRTEPQSRFGKSERVGLGYIMGIDLPRLVSPSYEVHGLVLKYEKDDDAVKSGYKKTGDIVRRYGGWEAEGACKTASDKRYTLAGQQMGHWLSAAVCFYNRFKNENSILLPSASLNGYNTSESMLFKGDITVTPEDIHKKIEYVTDKLDELQNTEIPSFCKTAVHKEYIGGCDEIPFLNCFAGKCDWCGVYWVPWYNIHKVYQGLLDVYAYAEKETALKAYNILKKLCDWAVDGISGLTDAKMQAILEIEHGGMNEVFAGMYEITGNEAYRKAAESFTHNSVINPLKHNDIDTLSGMHANTQIPKFIGAAKLYEQDREAYADYRTACENFWYNVNYDRCYAIGGNSLNEHFQISGTEELGVKTCESCNTYNMMRLTEHLFEWEHKSEYMDWYERALYNHVLGQQEPETGAKMYFVSMVQGTHRIYEQKYNSWWCCTGTGMENPARYTKAACFEDNDDLYINLYIAGIYKLNKKGLVFNVETAYPYSQNIKITVSGGNDTVRVRLRAPKWVSGEMTVCLNSVKAAVSNGAEYLTIENVGSGDVIKINIPMEIGIYKSRDNQKIAYEYGPLVLAARLDGMIKPEFEYIWEERNTACQQVVYPVLKTSDGKGKNTSDDLTSYITQSKDGRLEFILAADRNSTGREICLVPFADIVHEYHNIYFDLDTEIDEYEINLSRVQLDCVEPDGQQSELCHGMIQSPEDKTEFRNMSVQGIDSNGQYRFAYVKTGFFMYNMLIDKTADKNYLMLRYFDGDNIVTYGGKSYNVEFRIFADDTELECIKLTDGNGRFVDKLIEIPYEITEASTDIDMSTGYNTVKIKFVPYDDMSATVPYRKLYTVTDNPAILSGIKK